MGLLRACYRVEMTMQGDSNTEIAQFRTQKEKYALSAYFSCIFERAMIKIKYSSIHRGAE